MIEILATRVNNIKESIIISGLPKSTSSKEDIDRPLTDKDWKRAKSLGKAKGGSGHDCLLKGINVFLHIKASEKFWKQFDRYHFADVVSSTSTMHKIMDMDLSIVLPDTIYSCTRERLQRDIDGFNYYKGKDSLKPHESERMVDLFEQITDNIPQGFIYERGITTNYLQLKSMFGQRDGHKLKDWREFCEFIKGLPHFKELILKEML